ncbi:MAG: HAD-IIIA family hydrolase [Candidatus Omnitrophica bacterium]|nr:HAD-IIIA family hydrolase [Candidatus Omnitrophota bacterium]
MKSSLRGKIKKIKLLVMDVDGVLTDGRIVIDAEGKELKFFDVQDGFGLVLLRQAGIRTAVLSARSAPAVMARVTDLKIDKICQDAYPKSSAYEGLLNEWGLKDEEVCFMGDDLPDLPVLNEVGLAVAVSNAVAEVKKTADYVTEKRGGHGAVREVVEMILKVQGKWPQIVADMADSKV